MSTLNATGDVVVGDRITFTEGVFGGSHRNPNYLGDREIVAEVIRDSYGASKQQHTFTLRVISSAGFDPVKVGKEIRRKGRNVYRNGVLRETWTDESERDAVRNEKHSRGDAARFARNERKRLEEARK